MKHYESVRVRLPVVKTKRVAEFTSKPIDGYRAARITTPMGKIRGHVKVDRFGSPTAKFARFEVSPDDEATFEKVYGVSVAA